MPSGIYKRKPHTEKTKMKISKNKKGKCCGKNNPFFGKHHTQKTKNKMIGNKNGIGNKGNTTFGENHHSWIKDRTKLKKNDIGKYDSKYKEWMKSIKNRDNWKCKINNKDCNGKIVAHHILPWSKFPELRYEINNGISLCHFHHPRKRNDEIKLIPVFKKLLGIITT